MHWSGGGVASDIAPRLARNSAYYALKSVVALAAMLLVTPYILTTIGKAQYGIWALAGVIISYAQLSDFGITESLVKYAAEYHANRDITALKRLVNTAFVILLILAVTLGSVVYLALPFIARDILNIPPVLQEEALFIFRMAVMIFLANMIIGIFTTLIVSSQQIGYTCSINIASSVVGVVGTFVFLSLGWGLRGLVATNAIVACFTGLLNIYVAFRLFPELRFSFITWVDRPMFKQIITFSWKVQTSNISQLMIFQIDRILLSRYLGLEAVAYYEVGSTIAFYAKTFLGVLFAPIIPAVSALQAKKEHAMITGLYNRSFKFMALLAVPFCLLVIALADPFIRMWMGPGFGLSALTLQLLIPAYLFNVLTSPGTFILNGINRPDIAMRSALFAGAANLLLCFALVKTVGYYGLIIGITVSLLASAAYFIFMFHHVLPDIEWSVYRALYKPFLFSIPAALLLYALDSYWNLAHMAALATFSLLYLSLMVMLFARSSYLDQFERKIFSGIFLFKRGTS
jgi:O-antigen/teichoic acid export membrane protein